MASESDDDPPGSGYLESGPDDLLEAIERTRTTLALILRIRFTEAEDGWITTQVMEFPAAISQGRSRQEAFRNVIHALVDLLPPPPASRSN